MRTPLTVASALAALTLTVPVAAQALMRVSVAAQVSMQVSVADSISFSPPAGWRTAAAPFPYKLRCIAGPRDDQAATLSVQETISPLSVDRYVQKLLNTMTAAAPQTRLLSRGPFVTSSGLHGWRAAFDRVTPGLNVHFVLYAFPGAGHRKFLVAGLWPAADTAKYEAAADASLKTFRRH